MTKKDQAQKVHATANSAPANGLSGTGIRNHRKSGKRRVIWLGAVVLLLIVLILGLTQWRIMQLLASNQAAFHAVNQSGEFAITALAEQQEQLESRFSDLQNQAADQAVVAQLQQ